MIWPWIVLALAMTGVIYRLGLAHPRAPRAPPVDEVSPQLRARLGPELTAWLVATRELRARLVVFEEQARTMLEQELAIEGRRPFEREVADANFLLEIREIRSLGSAWVGQLRALRSAGPPVLADLDLQPGRVAAAFELPWRLDIDRYDDRVGELRAILEAGSVCARTLALVDGALSAQLREPYR